MGALCAGRGRRDQTHGSLHEAGDLANREIVTLRDILPEEFASYQGSLPSVLRNRAGYVIAENQRVLEVVARLERNDLAGVGQLLWQTHAGLRSDYEVSCQELDTLVDLACSVPGVLGARMIRESR